MSVTTFSPSTFPILSVAIRIEGAGAVQAGPTVLARTDFRPRTERVWDRVAVAARQIAPYLVKGVVALVLLAALQLVVARTTTWLPGGRSLVTARPTLLLEDGRPIPEALDRQRITMSEFRQCIRASGSGDLSSVAVVLATDGSTSVISTQQAGNRSALEGVAGTTEHRQ